MNIVRVDLLKEVNQGRSADMAEKGDRLAKSGIDTSPWQVICLSLN
jgi:hypothetical protein